MPLTSAGRQIILALIRRWFRVCFDLRTSFETVAPIGPTPSKSVLVRKPFVFSASNVESDAHLPGGGSRYILVSFRRDDDDDRVPGAVPSLSRTNPNGRNLEARGIATGKAHPSDAS